MEKSRHLKHALAWPLLIVALGLTSLTPTLTNSALAATPDAPTIDSSSSSSNHSAVHKPHINDLLDGFHHAAAMADEADYFSRFTADGIFMGTDASERWTVEEFKAYARPIFAQGRGWTYHKLERHITLDASGQVGWFDEILDNDTLGRCRGTGVVIRQKTGWKINHYSLSLLVPNSVADEVGALTQKADRADLHHGTSDHEIPD